MSDLDIAKRALGEFVNRQDSSPMAILGAAVKFVSLHGNVLEKLCAEQIDDTVKRFVQAAQIGRDGK